MECECLLLFSRSVTVDRRCAVGSKRTRFRRVNKLKVTEPFAGVLCFLEWAHSSFFFKDIQAHLIADSLTSPMGYFLKKSPVAHIFRLLRKMWAGGPILSFCFLSYPSGHFVVGCFGLSAFLKAPDLVYLR